MYFIKKNLGFGRIFQDGEGIFRYYVADSVHMGYLINIFKGRLRLAKTNEKFEIFVKAYTERYKLQPIELTREKIVIDNTNA